MKTKTKQLNKIQAQVVAGAPQFDVSEFPAKAERSVKGALYFRPNTLMTITADEFKTVQDKRPDMVKYIVVDETKKPTKEQIMARVAAKKAQKEAKAKPDVKDEDETDEEAKAKAKKKQPAPANKAKGK